MKPSLARTGTAAELNLRRAANRSIAFCFWLLTLLFSLAPLRAEVVISEFLAENDGGLADAEGDHPDWIELYNNGSTAVSLSGWYLTDDPQLPMRWPLPGFSLNPGERRIIFASGKDRRDPLVELHTNFSLQNSGGYLALRKPDNTKPSEWNPYPPQRANISFGSGTLADSQDLITASSGGKYLVPTNSSPGTTWTASTFDDSTWNAGSSNLGYQSGSTPPGLPIAYWTFDDTTLNEIPGGPGLDLAGAVFDSSVPAAIADGHSLHFSRSGNTYATADLNVSETTYTVSFWFRTSSPTAGLFAVHSGALGANGHDRHIYLTNGNIGVRIYNSPALVSTGMNYADNQWHHVVHVFGGNIGGQRAYVDGVLVLSGTKAQSDFVTQDHITVGFSNDATGGQYDDGEIDDLAIWSEALNPSAIQSLAAGTSPLLVSGFQPYINTNVETAMRNVNASLYLRLPFTVDRALPFNSATLRVRYDDGFIAYLDGVEVARRNAPATPAFDSTATLDRPASDAIVQESIDLSGYAGLLTNGSHILAIQALNDSAASADFLFNAELTAATLTTQSGIYMDPPTPGAANNPGFAGFVADTAFSPKRGFYDTPQNVTISSATLGATIAYTIDGTDPTPTNGTQVPASSMATPPSVTLNVASGSAVRAMAYKSGSGLRPTNVDSHTYIFPNQVLVQPKNPPGFNPQWAGRIADYAMDPNVVNSILPGYSVRDGLLSLPTISLTCRTSDLFAAPSGIYYNPATRGMLAERKVSLEWINPDGSPGWQVQAGVRLHGYSSRNHSFTPKHSLSLKFRETYGASKLQQDIFMNGSVDRFDQLILRACSTDSFPVVDGTYSDGEQRWNNDKATYLRDQFMRDTLNDLGHPNCRGRYCHLYINGLYWGLYNLTERPNADFFAETFGGKAEEWDVIKDFQELNDGTVAAWNTMMGIVNDLSLPDFERAQKLIGNNPDGTRNPDYEIYLHLPSFIDYMIVHIAGGAEDWPDHDFWAGRRRGPLSDGFHFVAWDQEISNDSLTRKSGRGSGNPFETVGDPINQTPVDRNGPAGIYDLLRRVPAFNQMFRERIHSLLFNNGPLTPSANKARWALRMAEIDKAIVAESARWGDAQESPAKRRETTWLKSMTYMMTPGTGYWDAIQPIDVQRFRNALIYPSIDQPTMSQNGGKVLAGVPLYFTSDQSDIYYTLDGSDPMRADGQPSASAQYYQGGYFTGDAIPAGATWRYLATPVAPPPTWTAPSFNDAAWPEGPAQLGYGDGDEATVIPYGGDPNSRFITTYFRKRFMVDAPPMAAKLYLLRDDGAVVYLNGKEIIRSNIQPTGPIGYSTTASTNADGVDESDYFYEYTLSPSDFVTGENVLAVEVHQVSASSDDLSFDAKLQLSTPSGGGGIILGHSGTVNVRALSPYGEWSGMNSAYFSLTSMPVNDSNVVISELHYHPLKPTRSAEIAVSSDADDYEFIELLNIGSATVDFTGIAFTAGIEFHFPSGYVLSPGKRCVVVKNAAAFTARYGSGRNVAGVFENGTTLSNSGETITLSRVNVGTPASLRTFTYSDQSPWPASPDGAGPSLMLRDPMSNPDHNLAANWIASADDGGTPAQSPSEMTFGTWRTAYRDTLVASGDDDNDGIVNALEYALALNPLQRNEGALPRPQVIPVNGQPYLSISFRRRSTTDLNVAVESSQDLMTWTGAPSVVLVASVSQGDGTVVETWRCAAQLSGTLRRFLRLRAIVSP